MDLLSRDNPIKDICALMGVSRAGYYKWKNRVLSPEPKFVQKKRQLSDNKSTYENVSTFEKEIPEKS